MEHRKQENNAKEQRVFNVEHRADKRMDGEKEALVIGGLAAVYDQYTNMGWYLEVIRKGFFEGIDTAQTAALKNHDANLILGRTANGTLKLTDKPEGLDYEAIVPDTQVGRDTYEEVKGGYIYQSSFAFTVKEAIWREVDRSELSGIISDEVLNQLSYGGKIDIRELVKGSKLYDVSPVTFPAYQNATSEARSNELKAERDEFLKREKSEQSDISPDETEDQNTEQEHRKNSIKLRLRVAMAASQSI